MGTPTREVFSSYVQGKGNENGKYHVWGIRVCLGFRVYGLYFCLKFRIVALNVPLSKSLPTVLVLQQSQTLYELQSKFLKRGYLGDYIGEHYRGILGV